MWTTMWFIHFTSEYIQITEQYHCVDFWIFIYGVNRLSCGCIIPPDLYDVDSDRESTVYFGNKAYNVGQPLESTWPTAERHVRQSQGVFFFYLALQWE